MSEQNTLKALAERCEQASGPDREINKDILLALGYSWRGMNYWHSDDKRAWEGSISFTASLDTALTLVPEGWAVEMVQALSGSPWHAKLRACADCRRHGRCPRAGVVRRRVTGNGRDRHTP
jgi:hypothetical protein